MNEYLRINGIDLGFIDHSIATDFQPRLRNSKVNVRKGNLKINLFTPSLELTPKLHNGLLGKKSPKVDYLRFASVFDLVVPEGKYDTQITFPQEENTRGFEVFGFPEQVVFHGIIDVQKGHLRIHGVLKKAYEDKGIVLPIDLLKRFDPKPLIPPRTNYNQQEAKEVDPLLVFHLSIDKKKFTSFEEDVLPFKNLEKLWIGGYGKFDRKILPQELFELKQLHTLQIYISDIEQLPPEIEKLQNLEELSFEASKITEIPDSLSRLPNLEKLSLKSNKLTHLPEDIGEWPALQELFLEYNEFKTLPKSLQKIPVVAVEPKDRKLFLDVTYQSKNPNPINDTLFHLSAKGKEELEVKLNGDPLLKKFKEFLVDSSMTTTYLVVEKDQKEIGIGASKLGGAPDLPATLEHPRDKNGNLFIFHAQINCEEIAPYQGYLPRTGLLYFFVNDEEYAQESVILYAENTDNLSRFPYGEETTFSDSDYDGNIRKAVAVRFINGVSLPELYNSFNHGPQRFPKYAHLWESKTNENYIEIERLEEGVMELSEQLDQPVGHTNGITNFSTHSMNSSVFTQHESPQEQAGAKYNGAPSDWMVLLCLESIGEFNFWDAGTLSYCVHKKDLAIVNFSKVYASIESS